MNERQKRLERAEARKNADVLGKDAPAPAPAPAPAQVALHLGAAAVHVIDLLDDPTVTILEAEPVFQMWCTLTGLSGHPALDFAQAMATARPEVTAHVAPF